MHSHTSEGQLTVPQEGNYLKLTTTTMLNIVENAGYKIIWQTTNRNKLPVNIPSNRFSSIGQN